MTRPSTWMMSMMLLMPSVGVLVVILRMMVNTMLDSMMLMLVGLLQR